MDDLLLRNRLSRPVITGTPAAAPAPPAREAPQGDSFRSILDGQIAQTRALSFSRHAVNRMEQRGIGLSDEAVERLEEGMQLARQKGLDDALILMDGAAFIVSARNGAIITAMGGEDLKNSVITNISGTVIL